MTNPLRILVVEDTADDAEVTMQSLSREGFAPDWKRVESAEEMRNALAERLWDVVVSDYSLPGFSAPEALALARTADPDMPFVVVSGTMGEQQVVEMMRAGAGDYLLKGCLSRLSAAVEREVREAENRRSQKRAEEAMRASETRYRRLFEVARDGILIVDAASRQILDANPFLSELLGFAREELLGKELWQIGLYSDIEANKAGFRTIQEQGYIRYDDLPLKAKGGRHVQVEFVSNMYDNNGTQVIQCNIRDITEQKRSKEAVLESDARFRAVVDSNMLATFFWRELGLVTECNDAFLAIVGYTRDDVTAGRVSWVDMTPPECNLRDMNALAEIARSGRCVPYEKEYIRKDGSRVPILLGAAGLGGGNDGVAFAIDLTERKQAEERLARAALILANVRDSVIVTDANGIVNYWNDYAFRLFGWTADEMLGTSVLDRLPKSGHEALESRM